MVYEIGDTLYVARPAHAEELAARDDILVIERTGGQLCNTDIVRTVDRSGGYLHRRRVPRASSCRTAKPRLTLRPDERPFRLQSG